MLESDFDIHYAAQLARIELTPEEENTLGGQLSEIVHYVEKLKELDVDGVEPMSHAVPLTNVTRADEVRESISHEDALRNAPAKANGLFVVPKILE
jgi:aspartyl-tRNA(Asn)/glutamyl-tRNA(Gln) amidotransferase subunit C